jgi:putative effector of murein hydrolase
MLVKYSVAGKTHTTCVPLDLLSEIGGIDHIEAAFQIYTGISAKYIVEVGE